MNGHGIEERKGTFFCLLNVLWEKERDMFGSEPTSDGCLPDIGNFGSGGGKEFVGAEKKNCEYCICLARIDCGM